MFNENYICLIRERNNGASYDEFTVVRTSQELSMVEIPLVSVCSAPHTGQSSELSSNANDRNT